MVSIQQQYHAGRELEVRVVRVMQVVLRLDMEYELEILGH